MRDKWVAAQKPSQQHLAEETSLLGDYRSPTAVARVSQNTENRHFGHIKVLLKGRRGVVDEKRTLWSTPVYGTQISTTNKKAHETARRKQTTTPETNLSRQEKPGSEKYRL